MAIISCPGCGKRISSKMGQCAACGAGVDEPAGERKRRRRPNFQAHYLLSMVLFLVGGFLYYRSYIAGTEVPGAASGLLVTGFVWYIGARLWSLWPH